MFMWVFCKDYTGDIYSSQLLSRKASVKDETETYIYFSHTFDKILSLIPLLIVIYNTVGDLTLFIYLRT